MRCFVGLPLPAPVHEHLGRILERLRRSGAAVRWVPTANLHVTLKFLGDVDDGVVPAMRSALAEIQAPPLSLALTELGAFPDMRRPRVVWAGLGGDVAELAGLAAKIEERCVALGSAADERSFRAHLTLGRVKAPRHLDALRLAMEKAPVADTGAFRVEEFVLYRSELSPAGSRYEALGRFPLSAGD